MVVFKFRQTARLDPVWLMKMVQARADLTLLPPGILKLETARPAASPGLPAQAVRLVERLNPKKAMRVKPPETAPGRQSWWTTRATTGAVTRGFTREEILAEAVPDPRQPGGLFEHVRQLLEDLGRGLLPG